MINYLTWFEKQYLPIKKNLNTKIEFSSTKIETIQQVAVGYKNNDDRQTNIDTFFSKLILSLFNIIELIVSLFFEIELIGI